MRSQSIVPGTEVNGFVSRLDPRVKLILLVGFIAVLSLWTAPSNTRLLVTAFVLVAVTLAARLPVRRILLRSFVVLPFVGFFAFVLYVSGQPARALLILEKSYLSTWSVLLVALTTAPGKLISGAQALRVPALLSEVMQLTFRYLFVLKEEASIMQIAFRSRAGRSGMRGVLASSGMIAGLFLRSQERAERVHHAMLSRGYTGIPGPGRTLKATPADYLVLMLGLLALGSSLVL